MNRRLRRWSGALACALAFAAPVDAQVLTLDEALKLGEAQSPRLAAQRSAVAASSEQVGRAAELPDPRLRLGIENLPVSGADQFRYDRDSMTMRTVGVMQEFPNSAKRSARSLRDRALFDKVQPGGRVKFKAGLVNGRFGIEAIESVQPRSAGSGTVR